MRNVGTIADAGPPRFIVDRLGNLFTAIREGGADPAEPRRAETRRRRSLDAREHPGRM